MSTNLELAQDLKQETVDSGTITTVVSQTGENGRVAKWIKDAWVELQQAQENWLWMRKSFTVNTVASDGAYAYTDCTDTVSATAIARWAYWYKGRYDWKCYLSSGGVAGEYFLIWLAWEDFKSRSRKGTQTHAKPVSVIQHPTGKFVLGPIPDAVYVVSGDYQIGPQVMTADADVPEMPTRFHNLIVYEAMAKYGGSRIAPEAMVRAVAEGTPLRAALELDQLPRMKLGRPMV